MGVPQHVLRFWETKFDFVTPVKRAGGRRFYRPDDVETLKVIRRLLHDDGLTIKGVQRLFKEKSRAQLADSPLIEGVAESVSPRSSSQTAADTAKLETVLIQIEAARTHLETVLRR